MARKPSNKRIRKKSEYTVHEVGVLLEKVASGVSGVADGVIMNAERLDRFEKNVNARFDRLEASIDRLEGEVRALRAILGTPEHPNAITRKEYAQLEKRLTRVETALARQR